MPTGSVTDFSKARQARKSKGKPDPAAIEAELAAQEQDAPPPPPKALMLADTDERLTARFLPTSQIVAGDNPRVETDADAQRELNASVKERGILSPILVRPLEGDRYEIVAGWRRWTAAKANKMEQIPVVVRSTGDTDRYIDSLVENLQREDLDPIDEARAFRKLIDLSAEAGKKITQQQIATRVGKSQPYVANSLRLLNLEPEILDQVSSGAMPVGTAKALVSLPKETRAKLAKRAVSSKMSANDVEREAKWERERVESASRKRAEAEAELEEMVSVIDTARKQKQIGKATQIVVTGEEYAALLTKGGVKNVATWDHRVHTSKNGKIECDDDAVYLGQTPDWRVVPVCTNREHADEVAAEERRKAEEQRALEIGTVNEARVAVRKALSTGPLLDENGHRLVLYSLIAVRNQFAGWDRLAAFWQQRQKPTPGYPTPLRGLWDEILSMPIDEVVQYLVAYPVAETIHNVYADSARNDNETHAPVRQWFVDTFQVDDTIVWGGHEPIVRADNGEDMQDVARMKAAYGPHEYEPADEEWIAEATVANDGVAPDEDDIPCLICSYADQEVPKSDHDAAMKVLAENPPEADDPDGTETPQPDEAPAEVVPSEEQDEADEEGDTEEAAG